jgi:hypothetical protein
LINEQQLGDEFLGDVGAQVHHNRFHRLLQSQSSWPAASTIPDDTLPDAVDELIELLGRESGSSLAWQWSLRGVKTIGVAFLFSMRDHCPIGIDTPKHQLLENVFA